MKSKVVIALSIFFAACSSSVRNNEAVWKGFNPSALESAWGNRDTTEVNKWIVSLSDTSLKDQEFYSRVADLSNVTGFCYGNADPTEKRYWEIPQDERQVSKRNVAKVYQLYRESCLFMKKTSWDKTLPLQERYWNDSTELGKLKQAIDSLCKESPPCLDW